MPPRCTFHGSSGSSSSRPPTGKVPPAQGVLLQEITAYFTAPREAVKYVVTPLSVVTVGAAAPADEAGMTEVVLEKPRKDTIFGVVLKDYEHPYVDKVEASGLAHGKLRAGDQVLSINDWKAVGHHETAERLKQSTGIIRVMVLRNLREEEVLLEKPDKDTRFGVTLRDYEHPYIDKVASDGLAHGKLRAGDQVLSINDWKTNHHHDTAERLKQLTGVIRIKVLRSEEGGIATGRKLVKITL